MVMKQKQLVLCMGLSALSLFTSCNSGERDFDLAPAQNDSQTGKIVLKLNSDANFYVETRALDEANYRNTSNYTVQLFQGDVTDPWKECKGSESELEEAFGNLELKPGAYTVKAFYGTEEPYSRNTFRVEGSRTFNVGKGTTHLVEVSCLPTCGKLTVVFDSKMADYYNAYSVAYSGAEAFSGNSIAWLKTDTEPWYVRLKPEGETLTYTINVTAKDEYAHVDANGNKQTSGTATGQFTLQRNHGHKLTVRPNYTPTGEGGLQIEIEIDDRLNEHKETIVIPVDWL